MIEGVIIKNIVSHNDERGYFREILRSDDHLLSKFGQTSVTVSRPGTIKAWHYHALQDDLWYIAKGKALVGLYDMRKNSATYKKTQKIIACEENPALILIPIGVAHGYKVLGDRELLLFYHTTEAYNNENPDEGRIDHNDKHIRFNWNSEI